MFYGGLPEPVWRRMLHNESLVIRLCALRAFAQAGEEGARALLTGPAFTRPDESYPWVWALSQCVSPDLFRIILLSGHPAHGPLSRVRFLLRRAQREHTWPRQLSREACVDALVSALHPLQTLACAVRLLEMHNENAIPALLEVLRLRPQGSGTQLGLAELLDEKAECAAWCLGRLGRIAVPEIIQCYYGASPRVGRHLAMALWYIGTPAAKALPCLLNDQSPQGMAALLALEDKASVAMIQRRQGPVWLDDDAVRELAGIAFSDEERAYAAAGLGCFGPAASRTLPIIAHLSRDPDPAVRKALAHGLRWGGRSDTFLLLLSLSEDEDPEVREHASQALLALHQSPEEARTIIFHYFLTGTPEERRQASAQLPRVGLPPEIDDELGRLLPVAQEPELSHLLLALAGSPKTASRHQDTVLQILGSGPPSSRLAAARVLQLLPDNPAVRIAWRDLLWETDRHILALATAALGATGMQLGDLQIGPEELRSIPLDALSSLLGNLQHDQFTARDLLPVLSRPEPAARQAVATALGLIGTAEPDILQTLVDGLEDESGSVAAACAGSLVQLGFPEHGWALLRSPTRADQQRGAELVELTGQLGGLVNAFAAGRLSSLGGLNVLRQYLSADHYLALVEHALPHLGDAFHNPELATSLAALGLAALERVPEWLGTPRPRVQDLGLRLLDEILQHPLDIYVEWVAQRALVLPLDDPEIRGRLQITLSSFLARAKAYFQPGLLPLLKHLAESPEEDVAVRALTALSHAYGLRHEPEVGDLLCRALSHPHGTVRRRALREVCAVLPQKNWPAAAAAASEFPEGQLLNRIHLFATEDLEQCLLVETLQEIDDLGLENADLLHPQTPAQAIQLLDTLDYSPRVGGLAMRALWRYTGPTTRPLWKHVVQAATRPLNDTTAAHLANRWPPVVVTALSSWEHGQQWVARLGPAADPGLLLALKHKNSEVRLAALEAIQRSEFGIASRLRPALEKIATGDDDPMLRSFAAALLAKRYA